MTAAAFKATYADWKLIKTRGVVQAIFEIPLHDADAAYQVLGGMPDAAAERWFAIARLVEVRSGSTDAPETQGKQATSVESRDQGAVDPSRPTSRKSWHEYPPAQQAGILCADKSFQKFMGTGGAKWLPAGAAIPSPLNEKETADWVRLYCGVDSRALLDRDLLAKGRWQDLVSKYRAWMHEPELIG